MHYIILIILLKCSILGFSNEKILKIATFCHIISQACYMIFEILDAMKKIKEEGLPAPREIVEKLKEKFYPPKKEGCGILTDVLVEE